MFFKKILEFNVGKQGKHLTTYIYPALLQFLIQIEEGLLHVRESCFAVPTVTIIYQQVHWSQNKYTNILMPYYY